jgi:D-sedoheptulose 7-phosphate isomerase
MNEIVDKHIREHKKALAEFEGKTGVLVAISELIVKAFKAGNSLYLCGNGGSAADCQHIAGEFVGRFRKERNPLPAISLSADTSILTCIGNDYSFDQVFVRQVQGLMKQGDILWAFSTSGSSKNILKAVDAAKTKQASVIAFTGKSGSELEKKSDLCFCSQSLHTSTAQEMHILAYHIICDWVESQFSKNN